MLVLKSLKKIFKKPKIINLITLLIDDIDDCVSVIINK
jgi:hypothetical protein